MKLVRNLVQLVWGGPPDRPQMITAFRILALSLDFCNKTSITMLTKHKKEKFVRWQSGSKLEPVISNLIFFYLSLSTVKEI